MNAVHVARDGALARVTLDRPTHNVLDRALNRELAGAIRSLDADSAVAVIVLDGGTARGFSAGVEIADHTHERVGGMLADFHAAIRSLWACDCVTIAAIHGFAQGGGFELALACDLVLAEDDARLSFPEIGLGCYPPVAAAVLPSRVGWAVACELVLGGEPFTAARAATLGLVNHVCAPGTLAAAVDRFAAPFAARSPAVLREAKRALRESTGPGEAHALERIERRYLDSLMKLEDSTEGIQAYLEKRPARFQNR
jgi:cyclohexa-1,5-dienecarbonyl-CoA hydratase